MNSLLLNRSAGSGHDHDIQRYHNHRLLRALQSTNARFERARRDVESSSAAVLVDLAPPIAHYGGVNAIVIDRFEGK